jgi:hypothetical protein
LHDHIHSFVSDVLEDDGSFYSSDQKEKYQYFIDNYSLTDDKQINKHSNHSGKVLDFNSRFQAKQDKQETESIKNHFLNNVLPYMTQDEINQLQAVYLNNNEDELNTLWTKLMLSTSVKRATEEVLKQN